MYKLLMNLYFDNYTKQEAIEFIERCYQETPKQKDIDKAIQTIKETTGKDRN